MAERRMRENPPKHASQTKKSIQCLGFKKNGERCLKKTCADGGLCNLHQITIVKKSNSTEKTIPLHTKVKDKVRPLCENDAIQCPVCFETIDEKPLTCGHNVHRDCIRHSMKAECPICRAPLKLSKADMKQINENFAEAKKEWTEESENEAIQLITESDALELIGNLFQMGFEIMMADPICENCLNIPELMIEIV